MTKNFSRVYAAQPYQLEGHIVSVEIDITHGLHTFSLVGLPDKAVEEARDRVSSAIKNSGFVSPKQENQKTIVSLAPAELRKNGSYFDLAIAVGYLLAHHAIDFDPEGKIFIGELSLNGELQSVVGILPIVRAAQKAGFKEVFLGEKNAVEAALIEGVTVYPAKNLREVINHLDQELESHASIVPQPVTQIPRREIYIESDFAHIKGNEVAKRGLEIAAAGGHNMLMSGPPGTGKTMLARAFREILPPLSYDEILEVTGIHSIAGMLKNNIESLIIHPPFRSPHHTSSYVSLIGGGSSPKPGEITLAHRGVLFLDEFPEFDKQVIESLRQPLEDRVVHISRAKGVATFPAQFILLAAMNPCPCGNMGSLHKTCICNQHDIARYQKKISGPIMDRIDITTIVEHLDYDQLSGMGTCEPSSDIRERIVQARHQQEKRFGTSLKLNAHMNTRDIESLHLSPEVMNVLRESSAFYKLSPRAYHRIIKIARTIADLEGVEHILVPHILEAFQYRPKVG